jgi:hypothetical protein
MNVTCGCDSTYGTINMDVAVISKPTKNDSGVEEAFCANFNEPQNADPQVGCDLWDCSLVVWCRVFRLKLSGLEWGKLVGSCIHGNGSLGSTQGQKCCWLAEGTRVSQ